MCGVLESTLGFRPREEAKKNTFAHLEEKPRLGARKPLVGSPAPCDLGHSTAAVWVFWSIF